MTAVAFGRFVLDRDTRELRDAGRTVALSPKAYQLLEVLVTNRPKALAKSDLQEQLWPGTFVVEKNLVNLVAESSRTAIRFASARFR
jgi:two-component system OmpR family response regulator